MEESCGVLSLDDYRVILKSIYDNYKKHCDLWNNEKNINLKSKQIHDIYNSNSGIDQEFLDYTHSFKSNLDKCYLNILIDLECKVDITHKTGLTGRVKTEDSIRNKILIKSKDQYGSFSINKCLNDLLGLRIIDNNYKSNIIELDKEISILKEQGLHINGIYRNTDLGYKGYHIYFKESNKTFPIELQIWDSQDEKNNKELHGKYKQNYVDYIINKYNKF